MSRLILLLLVGCQGPSEPAPKPQPAAPAPKPAAAKPAPPAPSAKGALALLSERTVIAAGLEGLGELFAMVSSVGPLLGPPPELPFDPRTGWAKAGIDPQAGLALAVDPRLPAPQTAILVKMTDRKAFLGTLESLGFPLELKDPLGRTAIGSLGGRPVLVAEKQGWFVIVPTTDQPDSGRVGLEAFLDGKGLKAQTGAGARAWGLVRKLDTLQMGIPVLDGAAKVIEAASLHFGPKVGGLRIAGPLVRALEPKAKPPKFSAVYPGDDWLLLRFGVAPDATALLKTASKDLGATLAHALTLALGDEPEGLAQAFPGHGMYGLRLRKGQNPEHFVALGVADVKNARATLQRLCLRYLKQTPGAALTERRGGWLLETMWRRVAVELRGDVALIGPPEVLSTLGKGDPRLDEAMALGVFGGVAEIFERVLPAVLGEDHAKGLREVWAPYLVGDRLETMLAFVGDRLELSGGASFANLLGAGMGAATLFAHLKARPLVASGPPEVRAFFLAVDPFGEPLAGAKVSLGGATLVSDAEGRASWRGVPAAGEALALKVEAPAGFDPPKANMGWRFVVRYPNGGPLLKGFRLVFEPQEKSP